MWALFAFPIIVFLLLAFVVLSIILLIANWRYMFYFWAFSLIGIAVLIGLFWILNLLTSKTVLSPNDYHGSYIINRDYFSGKQSDWQYNHFRFMITEEDSIYFYETKHEKIINTYKGTVSFTKNSRSTRLILKSLEPEHHVLSRNPTTYRDTWNFYLVFNSPKFYNMYFKKGNWKPIE